MTPSSTPPLVTVLMCVHNGLPYLGQTLASILAQSFTDFELVVVEDGSTDQTWDLLRACPDPRLRLVRNERNLGHVRSLNQGLRLSRGRYVARHDADDLSHPHRLARQAAYLENHPEVGALSCSVRSIDPQGRGLGWTRRFSGPLLTRWRLLFGNPLSHPGMTFRRELVQGAGGYDENFGRNAEDYDLWSRLAGLTGVVQAAEVLLSHRVHPGAVSVTGAAAQRAESDVISLRNMAELLGRPVEPEAFATLFQAGAEPGRVETAAGLIGELLRAAQDQWRPDQAAWAAIRADAARRLHALARLYLSVQPGPALRVYGRLIGLGLGSALGRSWLTSLAGRFKGDQAP